MPNKLKIRQGLLNTLASEQSDQKTSITIFAADSGSEYGKNVFSQVNFTVGTEHAHLIESE